MNDKIYVATTDENGRATFEDLPPGDYEVLKVDPPGDYDIREVTES